MASDDTRWLEPDEREAWVPLVTVLLRLPATLDAQLQRDAGLTFYEYVVLSGLSQVPEGGLRMSDLAAVTSGALSRLSQVVTRMERRSWVARRPDPSDGRATRVVLLAEGRRMLESAAPGHVAAVRETLFDHLTPTQVDQLRRIAMKVAVGLTGPESLLHARSAFVDGTLVDDRDG